jgi:sigma-B regulation protein RsbU (phosphoserine phosphatase)
MNRGSIVLGLMPGSTFGEDVIDLAPGDAVVIYSDGVTEGMNEAEDFFGDERLVAVVEASADLPAEQLGRAVLATLKDFVGEAVQSDDVSLIVLKRTAAA